MQQLDSLIEDYGLFFMLAAMLAAVVVGMATHGRRVTRHDAWLAAIDARLENLHKDRRRTWARRLQMQPTELAEKPPLVPPPLPPRAPTVDATDWVDDHLPTEDLTTRITGKYPAGLPKEPPKGPNDDDDD